MKKLFSRVAWKGVRLVKKAHRKMWLDPQGRGRPKPVERWEEQFKSGRWKQLDSLDEYFRYMIIIGYLHRLWNTPSVLDVGCGHGSLLRRIEDLGLHVQCYHGIDISLTAIEQAKPLEREGVTFEVVDVERWVPPRTYDVIVFNESLYYLSDPISSLQSFARNVAQDGGFIVSMCRSGNHHVIWKKIEALFPERHRCTVENRQGSVADIKVMGIPKHARN